MTSPMQPSIPNMPDIGIKPEIHVFYKNSPEVEELASVPATVRIVCREKKFLLVATSRSLYFEAVITADAADDIVRRMNSEKPTEDHDAIL